MPKKIDLTGKQFGRVTVIKEVPREPNVAHTRAQWWCRCSCGKEFRADSGNLRYGETHSCGCLRIEQLIERKFKHGHAVAGKSTSEYNSWKGMLIRCLWPDDRTFQYYGGRGITVCDRWLDFRNFLADMGLKSHPKLTIDRINNDGNYEPGNCRWATYAEQARNKRKPVRRK